MTRFAERCRMPPALRIQEATGFWEGALNFLQVANWKTANKKARQVFDRSQQSHSIRCKASKDDFHMLNFDNRRGPVASTGPTYQEVYTIARFCEILERRYLVSQASKWCDAPRLTVSLSSHGLDRLKTTKFSMAATVVTQH